MTTQDDNIIEISHLKNFLGGQEVHSDINLTIKSREIVSIIGGSGCGKTTLLRSILKLRRPSAGHIKVFGIDVLTAPNETLEQVRARWGVMFQSGALFSSMTVMENIMFPMTQFTHLKLAARRDIAMLKILMVGLEPEAANKYPGELSGGMCKRAALARAIAMDPELLFLDEPTAGLDPKSAGELDDLILNLRETLGITFVMVTHDLDTLWRVPDTVVFIGEGKVLAATSMKKMVDNKNPLIQAYFSGPRNPKIRGTMGEQDGV